MKKAKDVKLLIEEKQQQVDKLNSECAEKMAAILEGKNTRILSYNDQKALDDTIEYYTKRIAKRVVDIEDLSGEEN